MFLSRILMVHRYVTCLIGVFGYLLFSYGASALTKTGYYALDNAAISVKNTSTTPLVAITRVGQRLVAVGLHGVIIFSDDNGLSWRQASVPVDLTLTAIYFASQNEGWVVGHYGVILHTVDGGLTWSKSLDGLNVITSLNATAKQAEADPISDSDTKLKQRVASAFLNAGPSKPFLAIGRCGKGILAAGQQDMAMFSSDGGKTWNEWTSKIDNPTFRNIYAIVDEGDRTFLIGESGLILMSNADCENFISVPGPYTATLFGGLAEKPNSLLVYGLNGSVFQSNDDGATWATVSLSTDSVVDSGLLLDTGRVVLGALNGGLYLNDDENMRNFRLISAPIPFEIAGISIAQNGNLITIGDGGVAIVPSPSFR